MGGLQVIYLHSPLNRTCIIKLLHKSLPTIPPLNWECIISSTFTSTNSLWLLQNHAIRSPQKFLPMHQLLIKFNLFLNFELQNLLQQEDADEQDKLTGQ